MNAEQIVESALLRSAGLEVSAQTRIVAAALREAGIDLDHTYEQIGWAWPQCDGRGGATGAYSFTQEPTDINEEWLTAAIRRPLGEDQ